MDTRWYAYIDTDMQCLHAMYYYSRLFIYFSKEYSMNKFTYESTPSGKRAYGYEDGCMEQL